MNFTTIYDALNINTWFLLAVRIASILAYALILFGAVAWYRHEKKKETPSKIRLYILLYAFILGCSLIVSSLFSIIRIPIYKNLIYDQYVDNNVYFVEGIISVTMNEDKEEIDTIMLNGVEFNLESKFEYNYSAKTIPTLQNGEYVRITYVSYNGNNFIMKIDKYIETQ